MEALPKNILKTIIYADLFDYPLTAAETHRYLISSGPTTLADVLISLQGLAKDQNIIQDRGYYFLPGRSQLVTMRQEREKNTKIKMSRVGRSVRLIGFFPWVRFIGLTGALAVDNADEEADVDLLVVSSANRLWLTRFIVFIFLRLTNLK